MAKKKSNFISYELQRLEIYLSQLQSYLDKNPPDLMVDRIEEISTPRGGTSIKVIASIEDQLKMFLTALEKLPNILADINRLRKEVDDDKKEVEVRGGQDVPGFMDDDDDIDEETAEHLRKNVKNKNQQEEEDFDDDSYYDGEPKQLPAPEEPKDEEDDE